MTATATSYRSFLLRMWTRPHSSATRVSLTDVATGERHVFRDLEQLVAWLSDLAAEPPAS